MLCAQLRIQSARLLQLKGQLPSKAVMTVWQAPIAVQLAFRRATGYVGW
jgi:hypothetical protein